MHECVQANGNATIQSCPNHVDQFWRYSSDRATRARTDLWSRTGPLSRFKTIRAEHVHVCEIFEKSRTCERARKGNSLLGGPPSGTHDWTRALFGSCRATTWLQWGGSCPAGPACVAAAT